MILQTLEEVRWVIGGPKGAATKLGLKRTTLIHKMQKLGIRRPGLANDREVVERTEQGSDWLPQS